MSTSSTKIFEPFRIKSIEPIRSTTREQRERLLDAAARGCYGYPELGLFGPDVSSSSAMIFLGACMCITAFPMLARIIQFKKLNGTTMGTVAIGAGAIDDATAWCLLALVLANIDNNWSHAVLNIGGGVLFVTIAFYVIKPLLARLERHLTEDGSLTESGLVVGLSLMALGAWWTDFIRLHAVFGAFVMGAVLPRSVMARDIIARIQPLTVALLLPLFFTYSGLNTQIAPLNTSTSFLQAFSLPSSSWLLSRL